VAARALADIAPDDPRSVPVLIEALSYNGSERTLALVSLTRLGAKARDALPELRKIVGGTLPLQHGTPLVSSETDRRDAAKAIPAIEGRPSPSGSR
jgi:hypothetical protein